MDHISTLLWENSFKNMELGIFLFISRKIFQYLLFTNITNITERNHYDNIDNNNNNI